MNYSPLIDELIKALQCQPGIGARSAQRICFHLLERDREGALALSNALQNAATKVGRCSSCRTFTEADICTICSSSKRNREQLCIVENPSDVVAIEKSTDYRGCYFVLLGRLSPLDGLGPKEIGLDQLESRLKLGEVKEIILATNPTVEGEATAHYVADIAHGLGIRTTRIAHGVPVGGELDYIDSGTIAHAFSGRRDY